MYTQTRRIKDSVIVYFKVDYNIHRIVPLHGPLVIWIVLPSNRLFLPPRPLPHTLPPPPLPRTPPPSGPDSNNDIINMYNTYVSNYVAIYTIHTYTHARTHAHTHTRTHTHTHVHTLLHVHTLTIHTHTVCTLVT